MDLLSLDLSQVWDFVLAQTPSPIPSPSPVPSRAPEIELLRNQLEFLKDANTRLSDSFTKFVEAMKFTLVAFGFLGAFLAYVFGKNLDDARKLASQMIRQEVENHVGNQIRDVVSDEIENVKRVLGRERIISTVTVDYYLPGTVAQVPDEYTVLRERGFRDVQWVDETEQRMLDADLVVLDLAHLSLWSEQDADEIRQQRMAELIDQTLKRLAARSILVVYVRPGRMRVNAIDELASRVRYYASANTPVTLMGVVTDAAYVAYGCRQVS
jgi:hypothetical protein